MIRSACVSIALLASGTAAAQGRMSDYVRGLYEERCLKQEVSACRELIAADFGVPDATRARALAVRGAALLRNDAADDAAADFTGALKIAEAPQDPAMARLDAARGVSAFTAEWRSMVHAGLADAQLRRSDKASARIAVEQAIKLDAGNGYAYSVRARIVGSEQQWPAALADFDRAIQTGMADTAERALTLYRRGVVRGVLKRPAESQIADFTAALTLDPTLAIALERRAGLYQDMGKHEDAVRDYDTLTTRAPKYAVGFNSACWTRAAYLKREFDKARAQCDQALALAAEPNTYDSAGLVALQQKRWQDAWTLYDKAVKGDAKMASALYGRGVAAKRLGRAAEGEADLAAASRMEAQVAASYASYGQTP